MGRCLGWLERRAPADDTGRLLYGGGVALGLPLLWGGLGHLVEHAAPWPIQALVLKPAFAGRSLLDSARRVEADLLTDQLAKARGDLRWLVSRPTADLSPDLVAAAAIESLAENYVDSWLAPLLAYAVFGLGGTYAYRAANTADAMWGYRSATYERLGKAGARLDDLLNLLPARVGALLLVLAGTRRGAALAAWRHDAGLTDSPNSGQSMAAAAGQLGVRLSKPGAYTLNRTAPTPGVADLEAARALIRRAMFLGLLLCLLLRRRHSPA